MRLLIACCIMVCALLGSTEAAKGKGCPSAPTLPWYCLWGDRAKTDPCCTGGTTTSQPGVTDPNVTDPDICSLPKDEGTGEGRLHRFYFNGKKCKKFFFKGIGGNENNFFNKRKCRAKCQGKKNKKTRTQ